MLQDAVHASHQLHIEEISSPLSAHIFDFCDPELFQETPQNSEVAASSNCCHEENSSYATNLSFAPDIKFTSTIDNAGTINTTPVSIPNATQNNSNLSIIFDSTGEVENDISASIDFSPSPPFSVPPFLAEKQDQFDLSSLQSQIPAPDDVNGLPLYPSDPVVPIMGPPLPAVYEEECLSSVPSYVRLNPSSPSCSFLDHTVGPYLQGNLNASFSAEISSIFSGSMILGAELQPQELEYQGDSGGMFCLEPLPQIINSTELQVLGNETQHLVNGGGNSTSLASEISSLEDSTFKVGKLSVEQRKEKIHRYMKKRNERNFSKKIKYACRKTLADSRPRVRGRFAKNDEFGEAPRTSTCSNHEEDTDEDVVVKEDDDISSNIFAHINGVNSFKCNYSIQSWI